MLLLLFDAKLRAQRVTPRYLTDDLSQFQLTTVQLVDLRSVLVLAIYGQR